MIDLLDPRGAAVIVIALSGIATALGVRRLIAGPTNADRIVALDILLAAAVVLCICASVLTGRTVFLDVGLGLALTGFVGTIGWARAVERGLPEEKPARDPSARAPKGARP
ncbi:MAG: monovalent cation/H+ antiporter complex subunit F [Rhodobacteraceae bacterium]|jgi:multicomponent Na+:H+ antiporter subunit F|nr:monovalent cation/H+ antiporter complex subunit F [Paracoccaceae bacterium]